jgi:hypothetical protein
VSGFPTVAFVSGKTGEVTVYQGDRSLPDLITFVKLKVKYSSAGAEAVTKPTEESEEPAKDEL